MSSTPVVATIQPVELEPRIAKLEEEFKEIKKKRKDGWDIVQILTGFLSSVVIVVVGWLIQHQLEQSRLTEARYQEQNQQTQAKQAEENRQAQAKQQEQNRLAQIIAQIESNRERLDTEIRAKMFETLVQQFFKGDLGDHQKLMLLHLLQTNFQEFFNSGSLFAMMETDFTNSNEKLAMRQFAQAMAERQELVLGAGRIKPKPFNKSGSDISAGKHLLNIKLTEIKEDSVRVKVKAKSKDLHFDEIEFDVSYFDMPFLDNTKLPDEHRFAVTLKGIDQNAQIAYLKVFEFDHDYIGSRDRPGFTQLKHHMELAAENKLNHQH